MMVIDVIDLNLFEHWFRSVFNRRHPYYVITSQMHGVKYAVNTANVTSNLKDGSSTEIEVSLNVYKGYSESVNWTDSEFLFDSNWMFEMEFLLISHLNILIHQINLLFGTVLTDTINPRFKHDLKILINLNASGGFELVNYTTGDIFKYNKSIDKNTDFVLDGVYAYRDINRVGIDTNRGIITLAPGKNEFKIKGDVSDIKTTFKFPFIYR
ncbi:phage tail family protein [Staphylococcus aureus]|nr:phage tail domain-containing protein [Staphylococcus aureus]TXL38945.1 phage tail family protein [Staphylococcus aureus]